MPWTYIFKSQINPISFVVVWFAIFKLYGAGLSFGNPNLNFNYFVMILILDPPFNKTSFTIFFSIYIWITTIWLSIVIVVVATFGTTNDIIFVTFMVYLVSFSTIDIFST
jgi:hypothetical protein